MTDVQWIPDGYVRLAVVNDVNLYSDDVRTLQKGQWLNDNVITFLLELIYNHLEPSKQEQVRLCYLHICDSRFILSTRVSAKYWSISRTTRIFLHFSNLLIYIWRTMYVILVFFQSKFRFSSSSMTISKQTNFWPVLIGRCFILIEVETSSSILIVWLYWILEHFPSHNTFVQLTRSNHQFLQIRELFVQNDFLKTESKPQLVAGRCAKQSNGSDCGLFVVEFGKVIMQERSQFFCLRSLFQMGGYNENTLKKSIPEDMTKNRVCWLNKARLLYERTNT